MKLILTSILLSLSLCPFAQSFAITPLTPLVPAVYETSGLIWLDDRLITHNDSGGLPHLYEIDTTNGTVTRTVVIANATNTDWEDICQDDDYIYLGDFGNNAGTRTDLRIYKIAISAYLSAINDTVYCDTLFFNYADQETFEPATYTTNYDAEAFIAYNDSLYIFTKNWGNFETNVYSVPKEPGVYTASIIDNFEVEGLVTGADYDADKNELLLTGYTLTVPFLVLSKGFSGNQFSDGEITRTAIGLAGSIQMEGVTALGNHTFLVSSENSGGDNAYLHRIQLVDFLGLKEPINDINLYPTLVTHTLHINSDKNYSLEAYNTAGKRVATGFGKEIDLSALENGMYIICLLDELKTTILTQKVVKFSTE